LSPSSKEGAQHRQIKKKETLFHFFHLSTGLKKLRGNRKGKLKKEKKERKRLEVRQRGKPRCGGKQKREHVAISNIPSASREGGAGELPGKFEK
jgi:hypothetical protein